jgi:glycosyltransferase involved in cell wall biosynthesis
MRPSRPALRDNPRPLRVVVVEDSLAENGAVRMAIEVATRASPDASMEIFALQPVRGGREASVPVAIRLTLGVPHGGRLRRNGAGALGRLLRACRRSDIVLSGSELGLGLLLGSLAARMTRRPFAVVVHSPLAEAIERWVPPRLQSITRRVLRHVEAALCVSREVAASVTANGLPRRRVHVIPNGVDSALLRRLAAEDVPPLERTIVGVGRLSFEKGFDVLVRAHAQVRAAGVDHRLELIGDGPERDALEMLARDLGVADSVAFTGFLENPFPRVARAEAFVLPSRLEGFPLSLLEALVLGVPVIAARTSQSAQELLGDDVGELVAGESVSALAEALQRHLEHPDQLRARARVGVERAAAYDLDRAAAAYIHALRPLARRHEHALAAGDAVIR